MTNEYGAELDRNGYAPSIIINPMLPEGACLVCGRTGYPLQRHEIFHGPYRKKSKKYGLWCSICWPCHAEVHQDAELDRILKRTAQRAAMLTYHWDKREFIKRFGKNYL